MNRNIPIVYALTFLRYTWFWLGIWVFYYLKFTNYAGIGLIETSLIVAMIVAEIPTGAVADLVGKKFTITISFLLLTAGMFMISFAQDVWWLSAGAFSAGVGVAFYSGAMEALLYDSLKEHGKEDLYDKVISKVTGISLVTPAVCGIVGGYLYTIQPNLPFIINTICYLVGAILTFSLVEPKIKEAHTFSLPNFIAQMRYGFHQLFKNFLTTKQTILLLSVAVITVICDQLLDAFLGVEFHFSPTQLPLLVSAIFLIAAFASHMTPHIKKYIPYKKSAVIIGLLIAVSLLVSPMVGMILGGISLILRASFQAIYNNISSILINEHTESKYRATTLSTFNLLKNIPYVVTAYYIGSLADMYSAVRIAFFLGVILVGFIVTQSILSHPERSEGSSRRR